MNKSSELHIALVEFSPEWLEVEKNLEELNHLKIETDTQLVILPEMFATGFCMEPSKIQSSAAQQILKWMQDYSQQNDLAIMGSVSIKEHDHYFNRLYFYSNGNLLGTYDKRHLFSYSGEDKKYTKGNERVIFDYLGWKICPEICYDLRFPVWSRNTMDYDLLINVANWPESRISVWNHLLQSRAIENMCYAVGVNRLGTDGNHLNYTGQSNVYFPSMEKIPINREKSIIYVNLEKNKLNEYREKYPFLKDKDQFNIKP